MKPRTIACIILAASILPGCVTSTAPNGTVTKSIDPAVTAAAEAILKSPEGQAILDAAVAAAVAKINPPKP